MTLFDLPPLPAVEPGERLSDTRRRTIRRRAMLEAGRHPTTKLGLVADGRKCRDCPHQFDREMSRTYHKCGMVRETAGPASDVVLSWPACIAIDRPAP